MNKGTKVVVERDEKLYPAKGSWKQFRGRKGTVTAVVRGAGPIEYGVSFTNTDETDAYFKRHELIERN
ncbi:hypothetical protein SEA_PHARAOH_47 [Mycobacterium phage Pharaoh]|uniref:Uncharacterized protein n=1 Tax=Mycobacterium phage Pharaoh TaxID=2530140 RepID=A0A481W244_9CAUD|nr:hypothetical protein KIV59_gp43 [Mycobacterium phage Pharaoh]QBJ00236.1 hypothetical protein SEA_PHARAOH_47 [Mycobacterium phage Pharaoh]